MALIDPRTPLRSDLAKVFKDPRTLKSFERLFQVLPDLADSGADAIEAAQMTADSAAAQAVLAIALLNSVDQLVQLMATEPSAKQCLCNTYEDLAPRMELNHQDVLTPSSQNIEYQNLNLEVL